ncbi:MAG: hypothetical protein QM564_05760 [Bergeyella sp.]
MTKALTQSSIKISKMVKKIFLYCAALSALVSCTTEKINLSPVEDSYLSFTGELQYKNTSYTERTDQINYAAEITNLIASLPKFTNDAVNAEADKLKYFLKDYIGGMEAYNLQGMEKSYNNYQKSYKKLQKLKPYLNQDEADVLNRYLVRIKTSMNILESAQQRNNSVTVN